MGFSLCVMVEATTSTTAAVGSKVVVNNNLLKFCNIYNENILLQRMPPE
jgi:hypothetical protein